MTAMTSSLQENAVSTRIATYAAFLAYGLVFTWVMVTLFLPTMRW